MVGSGHIVYSADCGVPCLTEETMETNMQEVLWYKGLSVGGGENRLGGMR
jgi:hypothetical protein